MMAGDPNPGGVPATLTWYGSGPYCPICGCYHPQTSATCSGPRALVYSPPAPMGWECPKCGAVMAPGMPSCYHCKPSEAVFPVNIADLPRLEPSMTAAELDDYENVEDLDPGAVCNDFDSLPRKKPKASNFDGPRSRK